MLSESFVASTLASSKAPASSALKDVGICIHTLQPSSVLRSGFKKSSTAPNCLAVSASHVFAAQAEKAVVHVYSRERGSQEATIPFPERIRSVALGGGPNGEVLVLGTESGRFILWEVSRPRGRELYIADAGHRPAPDGRFPPPSLIYSRSRLWRLTQLPASFCRDPRTPISTSGHYLGCCSSRNRLLLAATSSHPTLPSVPFQPIGPRSPLWQWATAVVGTISPSRRPKTTPQSSGIITRDAF